MLAFLKAHNLQLSAILITHHHFDHTGGISQLTKHYPHITVFGPNNPNIKGITHPLEDTDTLYLDELKIELSVMTVPGHTLDHIMYFAPGCYFVVIRFFLVAAVDYSKEHLRKCLIHCVKSHNYRVKL